ncbi:unnamed protein product [Symbiodinium sp. CCMP2592]|nr:unnamed protein product [Symbiodinium sp. CCMP2592]
MGTRYAVGIFIWALVFGWQHSAAPGKGAGVAPQAKASSYKGAYTAAGCQCQVGESGKACASQSGGAPASTSLNYELGLEVLGVQDLQQGQCQLLFPMWRGMAECMGEGDYLYRSQVPTSPRQRGQPSEARQAPQNPWTPAAGKGKGTPAPSGKGQGAKGKPSFAEVVKPSVDNLPAPPSRVPTVVPKAGAIWGTDPGSAREVQAGDSLPQEALQLYEEFQINEAQDNSRELHKAVATQSTARKQLIQIRSARTLYLTAWQEYLMAVSDTIQTQVSEQQTQLADFDKAELEWSQSLTKASGDLARLAAGRAESSRMDDEEDEMDAAEEMIDSAIQTERDLEQKTAERVAESQQFLGVLQGLRQAAAERLEQDGRQREGSRTPRRKVLASVPTYDLTKEGMQITPASKAEDQQAAGLYASLRVPCRPFLLHSIECDDTYVSALHATFLGMQTEFEVKLDALDWDVQHTFLADPRLPGAGCGHNASCDPLLGASNGIPVHQGLPLAFQCSAPMGTEREPDEARDARMNSSALLSSQHLRPGQVSRSVQSSACTAEKRVGFAEHPEVLVYRLGSRLAAISRSASRPCRSPTKGQSAFFPPIPEVQPACHHWPLSQPVRDDPSTALDHWPPLQPSPCHVPFLPQRASQPGALSLPSDMPSDPPPRIPGPKPAGFTDLRMQLAARVHVFPAHLDRPELRGRSLASFSWRAGHRLAGVSAQDSVRDRYVVFTSADHCTTRQLPHGWSIDHIVADLLGVYPRLMSVNILQERLEQLPPTQLTATMRDDPAGVSHHSCRLPPFQELVDQCGADCPPDRQARQAYQLLANGRDPFVELRLGPGEPDYLQAVTCDLPPAELLELLPSTTSTTSPRFTEDAAPSDLELALQGAAGRSFPQANRTTAFHMRATTFRMLPAIHIQRTAASGSVFFTVLVDPIRAQGHAHWTLQDFFRGAAEYAEASLHGIQLLMSHIPGLPTPQLVLSEGDNIGNARTVPIDLRSYGQGVLPLRLSPGTGNTELLEQVVAGAPALRHDVLSPLTQHRFFFRDAHGAVRTGLPDDVASMQWLELCHAPLPTGHLDPLALSVDSHGGTDESAALLQVSMSGPEGPISRAVDRPLRVPGIDGTASEPPALLGRLVPSDIAILCAASVKVLPDYLSGEASMNKEVLLSSWGGREATETRHFTVFDVVHQIRVLDKGPKSTLQDCIALALQATGFSVAHLRVLTVPVPGLPLPQVVLHRAVDPEPLDTLVWDLRAVGQPIKTTVLRPGVHLAAALQHVDGVRPSPPGVYLPWSNGQVVVQHVRVEHTLAFGAAVLHTGVPQSGRAWPQTTATTTNMQAPPLPPGRFPQYHVSQVQALRLRVVRGFHAEETVVSLPCAQVDRVLDSLVQRVAAVTGALQSHNRLMMAKAQPFDNVQLLEANFVISETPDLVVALCDTRHL